MSDELVPGLDISGFSPDKLARLNEFVATFEKLEKYNGMSFTPLSGGGITEMNAALANTNTLLTQLNLKVASLNQAQGTMAANAVRANAAITRGLAANTSATVAWGVSLTHAYGWLRRIAYILPGIGIAGIFNAAFSAIGDVADALQLTNNKLTENENIEAKINEDLRKQIELIDELYKQRKKLDDLEDKQGYAYLKQKTTIDAAGGIPKDVLLERELSDLKVRFDAISKLDVKGVTENVKSRNTEIADLEGAIGNLQQLVDAKDERGINQKIKDMFNQKKVVNGIKQPFTEKENEATAKHFLARLQYLKKLNDDDISNLEEYHKAKEALETKANQLEKFKDDEKRKEFVKKNTEELKTFIAHNEEIIKEAKYTEEEKAKAIDEVRQANNKLIAWGDWDIQHNKTSTKSEKRVSTKNAEEETARNEIKSVKQLFDLHEDYRQRKVKAITETNKNEIDADAEKNQRIFENEEKSLDERLEAYSKYIENKIKEQDLELKLQQEKLGKTPEEKKEDISNRDSQVVKIQADTSRKVYDIVKSSLEKQLKDVELTNKLQDESNSAEYAVELEKLNESFVNKEIAYKAYIRNIKHLQNKFNKEKYDEDVLNDKQELNRLRDLIKEHTSVRDSFQKKLSSASTPEEKDKAEAGLKAANDVLAEDQKEKNRMQVKLGDDALKAAKSNDALLQEQEKELAKNKAKIWTDLFALAKKLNDEAAQYEIEKLEKQKKATDEQLSNEINAVNQSSLNAKDKAALDIQLNEQKLENDKNIAAEEVKIKRKQAIIDRELAVAETIWSTERSVAEALPNVPLAITAGILGAIALATIMATPIPSFAEGVENFEGGLARYGEDGAEIVKEPYKSPYLVTAETIGYLPRGTDIIPVSDVNLEKKEVDSSWEQTRWLARQIKKNSQKVENKITNVIKIDLGFESHKRTILGN